MEKLYTVADCGSDHELLIVKSRLKLKKVGKTIRSFRYDLNQIPYDYTVDMRNRFKGGEAKLPSVSGLGLPDPETHTLYTVTVAPVMMAPKRGPL